MAIGKNLIKLHIL